MGVSRFIAIVFCLLGPVLLAPAGGAVARADQDPGRSLRLVVDPSTNHYAALEQFLVRRGYWPEERERVLDPLNGRLDKDHDTAAVRMVFSLDDIPGLRPLPDGVVGFLHGRHNTFYVEAGDDRLLVGFSHVFQDRVGQVSDIHMEVLDLISGEYRDLGTGPAAPSPVLSFLRAHDPFLGGFLRDQYFWLVFMLFLAWRRRRLNRGAGDPVVRAHRARAQGRLFLMAGAIWCLQILAAMGLMHFQSHILFIRHLMEGDVPTFLAIQDRVVRPERLRLLGLGLSLGLAVGWSFLLALWSGAMRRGPEGGRPA